MGAARRRTLAAFLISPELDSSWPRRVRLCTGKRARRGPGVSFRVSGSRKTSYLNSPQTDMDKTTQTLAHYAAELCYENLPSEVVHETKRKLIDTVSCAIGAFDEEPC